MPDSYAALHITPRSQRSRARSVALALLVLGSAALLGQGCGAVESYRLSVSADMAPRYFSPIAACAEQQKLTVSQHPSSIHVAFDDATWIQFMIQNGAFNMVIVVDSSVAEEQRPARVDAAKAKGDAIFACALQAGPGEAPAQASTEPTPSVSDSTPSASASASAPSEPIPDPPPAPMASTPSAPGYPRAACAKSTKACERDSQCGIEHCSQGFCYPSEDGCPCSRSTHCGAGLHCGAGYCYPSKAGTPCDGVDSGQCGSGLHCTKGLCYANATGSACDFREQCGVGASCVNGICN